MGVSSTKMGVCFAKRRVRFSKMGVWFAKIRVCFRKWEFVFRKWEFVFSKMGGVFLMMKMIDRPNTTPIGQDRASQWRNVTFSIVICLKLDLVILYVFDGISV